MSRGKVLIITEKSLEKLCPDVYSCSANVYQDGLECINYKKCPYYSSKKEISKKIKIENGRNKN